MRPVSPAAAAVFIGLWLVAALAILFAAKKSFFS